MDNPSSVSSTHQRRKPLAALCLGAIGVVFGDIGTSPLYAFKEAFSGAHALPLTEANVLGVLSLIFWSVMLIVSLKYVSLVLRFDNKGEGGVLALLGLFLQMMKRHSHLTRAATILAVLAAALFYGDAVITPAISVLSAVEGLSVAAPSLAHWVVPITIIIIVYLFTLQKRGTGSIGRLFGPITLVWFVVLGALGIASIARSPEILRALDPMHALGFAITSPALAFVALGAVFLTLTGGEALYTDMGHFGRRPIRITWFAVVLPALMLNYLGQGALVLRSPETVKNPFYLLVPSDWVLPLVALATAATVIASQATISGAFSVTQQASRLGFLPRIPVTHTSETERGQIYIGRLNWLLLVMVVLVVLGFGSSSHLASAYGIAVSATMALETCLVALVVYVMAARARALMLGALALILLAEMVFFASNATKIASGGWFPIVCGLAIFAMLTTWKRGAEFLSAKARHIRVPLAGFFAGLASVVRVPGTAVFFSADPGAVPTTLLHNLKHNKVLHERIILFSFTNEDVPRFDPDERVEINILRHQAVYQVIVHCGFMENPDAMQVFKELERRGLRCKIDDTTFFLGKSTIARGERRGLLSWRGDLFRWMQKNAPPASEYFNIPPDRVIELGTQLKV